MKNIIYFIILIFLSTSCNQQAKENVQVERQSESNTIDVDYQIMVQRATQTAIWEIPEVALVEFIYKQ